MRKKIRCSVPKLVKDIFKDDLQYFDIKMENLCNQIIKKFGFEDTLKIYKWMSHESKVSINFNLNDFNSKYFDDMLSHSQEKTYAEFFRRLFSTYANLHPSIREKIIYNILFKELEYVSKNKLFAKLSIGNNVIDVKVLLISRNPLQGYNQLEVDNNGKIEVYKLKDIELLKIIY